MYVVQCIQFVSYLKKHRRYWKVVLLAKFWCQFGLCWHRLSRGYYDIPGVYLQYHTISVHETRVCQFMTCSFGLATISFQCCNSFPRANMNEPMVTLPITLSETNIRTGIRYNKHSCLTARNCIYKGVKVYKQKVSLRGAFTLFHVAWKVLISVISIESKRKHRVALIMKPKRGCIAA